jgi:subfamily B ATP-binding cassette protein MsbA
MKNFLNIARQILNYWQYALLNIVFNMLSAFFALFSFMMAIPFLRILFHTSELISEPVPFTLSLKSVEHNLNYYLGHIITTQGEAAALMAVSLLVVVMSLMKNGFKFLANYYVTPARTGVIRDIRNEVYRKILKLPLSYFTDARKGDIMSRVSMDVNEIEVSVMSSLEMIFRDPITVIIFLVYLFITSYQLTIIAIFLLPVSAYLIGVIGKNLRKQSLKLQQQLGLILSVIEETLSGLRIIKAFNAEKKMDDRFIGANETYTHITNKVIRRRFLASPLSEFLATLVMMFLMYFGGMIVLNQGTGMKSEAFITFLIVFSQIITPAKAVSTAYYNLLKGMAAWDRIKAILDEDIQIREIPSPVRINEFKSSIEYRNVSFSYNTEPVLKNVSLNIRKGQTIAIVGKSGAGKSTLVDLLPRFMDPGEGEICIDGIAIKDYKIEDLRKLLGIVSQQAILFNDTFFGNIAFGMDSAGEEEVIAAAKLANAHDFIMETSQGYYSNIGEGGGKLSGGQRQRITIARALLANPPILILDEATSALDTESEKLVQEAITHLMQNRTSIVIAHRLSTIKHADEIIVLEGGEIVERGNHNDLLKKKGYYSRYHKLQMF